MSCRMRTAPEADREQEAAGLPTSMVAGQKMRPLLAHTHSVTLVHSTRQAHTHRTTLLRAMAPADGVDAVANTVGVCDELNARLLSIDGTLKALLLDAGQPHTGLLPASAHAAAVNLGKRCASHAGCSMLAIQDAADFITRISRPLFRARSLEAQLTFSAACLLDCCGAAPAGSAASVLRQLLAWE